MLYRTVVLGESDYADIVKEKEKILYCLSYGDIDVIFSKWDEHGVPGEGPAVLKTSKGDISYEFEMAPDYNGWKRKKDSLSM